MMLGYSFEPRPNSLSPGMTINKRILSLEKLLSRGKTRLPIPEVRAVASLKLDGMEAERPFGSHPRSRRQKEPLLAG